jgi:hypothetical protein
MLPLGPPTGPAVKDGERARKDSQKRPAFPAKAHGQREKQPNSDLTPSRLALAPATSAHGYAERQAGPARSVSLRSKRNGTEGSTRAVDRTINKRRHPVSPPALSPFPIFLPHLFGFAPTSEYPPLFTPASPPPLPSSRPSLFAWRGRGRNPAGNA